jgi:hypothetical protein
MSTSDERTADEHDWGALRTAFSQVLLYLKEVQHVHGTPDQIPHARIAEDALSWLVADIPALRGEQAETEP